MGNSTWVGNRGNYLEHHQGTLGRRNRGRPKGPKLLHWVPSLPSSDHHKLGTVTRPPSCSASGILHLNLKKTMDRGTWRGYSPWGRKIVGHAHII